MDLIHLKDIAVHAALAAGQLIKQYVGVEILVNKKIGSSSYAAQVVTEVDLKCEELIRAHLKVVSEKYDLAILSEETTDDGSRHMKDYFWCIDPMDGTLPFIDKRPGYSVSIALVARDGTPHLGVVYDPTTDTTYHAVKGLGAFKNDQPWMIQHSHNFLTYVTDKRLSETSNVQVIQERLNYYLNELGIERVEEKSGGGSVMNGIYVLENGPACMIKLPKTERGGGSLWDFAAVACIYHELGLPATNYLEGRLDLNRPDSSYMNHQGILFSNLYNDRRVNDTNIP
jgi:fructose-1,6-bisphosphatase/inositol monophosphatase family enzyme